jgi:hypothetical protein
MEEGRGKQKKRCSVSGDGPSAVIISTLKGTFHLQDRLWRFNRNTGVAESDLRDVLELVELFIIIDFLAADVRRQNRKPVNWHCYISFDTNMVLTLQIFGMHVAPPFGYFQNI